MRIFDLRSHCLSAWPLSVWKQASYLSIEPEHGHDCYEIMITLKDGGICLVGGSNYAIRAGSLFLCTPFDSHAYTLPSGNLLYNLMFTPDILSASAGELLKSIPGGAYQMFTGEEELQSLLNLLTRLEQELIEQRRGFESLTGAMMEFLITSIYRKTNELPNFTELQPSNEVEKIIAYIQTHYFEKITLPIMGRLIRRSPAYVGQLFRRVAGCSFSKYLLRYRVNKASELLKSSPLSLTEIAYQTGFFDSAHFAKSFSRITGQSPRHYRRQFLDLPPGGNDA